MYDNITVWLLLTGQYNYCEKEKKGNAAMSSTLFGFSCVLNKQPAIIPGMQLLGRDLKRKGGKRLISKHRAKLDKENEKRRFCMKRMIQQK